MPKTALWLSTEDLSARLGYSTGTLANLRCERKGPRFCQRTKNGKVLYRLSDVVKWEKRNLRQRRR